MKTKQYVGLDVGLKGGIAFIGLPAGSKPFNISPMPLMAVGKRNEVDVVKLWEMIAGIEHGATTYVLEQCSHHMPSQAAMRSVAMSYGKILGLLESKGCKVITMTAQAWQKMMLGSIPAGTTKAAALGLAKRLWPQEKFILPGCKTPHDGCIDAALMAELARRNNL